MRSRSTSGLGALRGEILSRGWHSGTVFGHSASAAAVGRFLGLNSAQLEDALGIACTQAGGLMSAQFGSMVKRMQHGFPARNGLFAALMAKEGYTGIHEVYETKYGGFLSCFGQGSGHDPEYLPNEICKDIGSSWEIERIRVKLHASMAALHGTIDCVENLQHKYPERLAELHNLARVDIDVGKSAYEHGGWIASPEKALTSVSAQMSIQYAASVQLVDKQVLMGQFSADKLH